MHAAERIRRRVAAISLPEGVRLTASFGVATLGKVDALYYPADELFSRADEALYAAKRQGKNRIVRAA